MQHYVGDELVRSKEVKWLSPGNDRSEPRAGSTTLLPEWEDSREVSWIL